MSTSSTAASIAAHLHAIKHRGEQVGYTLLTHSPEPNRAPPGISEAGLVHRPKRYRFCNCGQRHVQSMGVGTASGIPFKFEQPIFACGHTIWPNQRALTSSHSCCLNHCLSSHCISLAHTFGEVLQHVYSRSLHYYCLPHGSPLPRIRSQYAS
jgi:hypothetical protein